MTNVVQEHAQLGKNAVDMSGMVCGNWVILEFSHRSVGGACYWLCRCECGNVKPVAGNYLRNGKSTRCQKCNSVKGTNNKRSTGKDIITGSFWLSIRRNATCRGIGLSITIDDVIEQFYKQDGKCALSGIPLTLPEHCRDYNKTASLDRIDSTKPYELGNIQWVHKDVNLMKMDLPQSRLIELCTLIVQNMTKENN